MTYVTATDAGRDLLARLKAEHGAISLHVSGSYGVSVVCLARSELMLGSRGVAAGFSLEGPLGVHFTLRKRADPAKRIWDANAILAAGPPSPRDTRTSFDD